MDPPRENRYFYKKKFCLQNETKTSSPYCYLDIEQVTSSTGKLWRKNYIRAFLFSMNMPTHLHTSKHLYSISSISYNTAKYNVMKVIAFVKMMTKN